MFKRMAFIAERMEELKLPEPEVVENVEAVIEADIDTETTKPAVVDLENTVKPVPPYYHPDQPKPPMPGIS